MAWNIKTVPGLDHSQDVTYVNQYIPAPLHARVHKDGMVNQLIFHARDLPALCDKESRTFTTDKYSSLLCWA